MCNIDNDNLPAISDDDLRRILVWHDNAGLGKAASRRVRIVRLERLLLHTGIRGWPNFECLTVQQISTDR